jgi:hypothetical protein
MRALAKVADSRRVLIVGGKPYIYEMTYAIALTSSAAAFQERYSKPHVIEKKKRPRAASNASW